MSPPPEVRDVPAAGRFELIVDGRRAGYIQYRRLPDAITFMHTEIEPEFEGMGLGGTFVAETLARARSEGVAVLPYCPFVRNYIERHPEQLDLVPAERRAEFDLDEA